MTLDDRILEWLASGRPLTPAIAAEQWSVLALHSAVARIRKRGHRIECKIRRSQNGRTYGEYRMIGVKCVRKQCSRPASWLIGTALVPYCQRHAEEYPVKAGKYVIDRTPITQPQQEALAL